ncbi:hypothetical protein K493DRAFT_311976 [Basidiobolus meristosporus CBS 931.73]|uniref:Yeast cell wall synthesis Kre9/Knh1-like N-terminal domain-containing protein n=1 Tax=Basidiobolus meristosporus CBS 931.73 TaxID=1314790 RepID=A0A1Y1YXQ6_9FUNG|nr:hypothetical protein K493DRAFT_311976 [Basidiobolus meristosporus CBS 931.73]|eukprot:ORY02812.1 hypothetical protein K493DRAFT_311976 [Basidiobolus meristosporus CBS 931.73]
MLLLNGLTFLSSVAFLASSALGGFYITQPIDGTKWVSGTKVTINWLENNQTTTPTKFDITLMSGKADNLQEVSVVAKGLTNKSGPYQWTVPNTIPSGAQYAVRIGSGSDVFYSHFFDVEGSKANDKSFSINNIEVTSTSNVPAPKETAIVPSAVSKATSKSDATPTPSSTPVANVASNPDTAGKVPISVNGASANFGASVLVALMPAFLMSCIN